MILNHGKKEASLSFDVGFLVNFMELDSIIIQCFFLIFDTNLKLPNFYDSGDILPQWVLKCNYIYSLRLEFKETFDSVQVLKIVGL